MKITLFLSVLIILTIVACKEDDGESRLKISGITRTRENGQILSQDTNDWRPSDVLTNIGFCPNPITANNGAGLYFMLNAPSHVRIWAVNDKKETVLNILNSNLEAGNYSYTVAGLPVGLSRVYIEVDGKKKTYGDVEVEKAKY